eukprot:m.17196 g.17196  ORF g.17196 m.17196 type:complete len:197 (+) comp27370_c0_seq1:691-1281(+)
MKAYPWIDCSSPEYVRLFISGVLLALIYIAFLPLLIAVLLMRKFARNEPYILQAKADRGKSCLDTLYRDYKRPYQTSMAVLLMLRRLALAAILSGFSDSQRDLQAIPFNLVLISFTYFVVATKPFKSVTKWNLESWADAAASLTVAISYNCMSNREKTTEVSEILVLAINIVNILFLFFSILLHLWVSNKIKKRGI